MFQNEIKKDENMGTLSESNIWEDIPDTWLLEIFQYLDFQLLLRCSVVCKKWQRVALDESLWKKLVGCKWNIKSIDIFYLCVVFCIETV